MKPSDIQDALVAALAARYPTIKVEAHGGNFTEKEIPFLMGKAPLLLVAFSGFSDLSVGETPLHWQATIRFSLVMIGADTSTTARDDLAVDTVFDLLAWLPSQDWGLTAARLLDRASLTADNLYTGTLNTLRIALWAVSFEQTFSTFYLEE